MPQVLESMTITIDLLSRIPFFLGHKESSESYKMQLSRWEHETQAAKFIEMKKKKIACLVISRDPHSKAFSDTITSLKAQTIKPDKVIVLAPLLKKIIAVDIDTGELEEEQCKYSEASKILRSCTDWAIFLKEGDICSPSLIYRVAVSAQSQNQLIYWNVLNGTVTEAGLQITGRTRTAVRASAENGVSIWHAFAGRASIYNRVIEAIGEGLDPNSYLDKTSFSYKKLHDYLIVEAGSQSQEEAQLPKRNCEQWLSFLKSHHNAHFEYFRRGDISIPLPARSPNLASAIIMYKDKPLETEKCIKALLSQELDCDLELILVDNQSTEKTKAYMADLASRIGGSVRVNILKYDDKFNHSAQLIYAISQSLGDVICIVNNDLFLEDKDTILHASRWAMCENIASVGIIHRDEENNLRGGPLKIRETATSIYDSPVEEYSRIFRAPVYTAGNSFAFAVVKKTAFETFSVDPARFPNGYNDVEYCLRSLTHGFDHITLGYIEAVHLKSISRNKEDETSQKMILRELYPNLYLYFNLSEEHTKIFRQISIDS